MANIYFTGDTHYSHANILKYSKRTLFMNKQEREVMERNKEDEIKKLIISKESVLKHNEGIIERFNSRVKKDDVCYINGDFSFKNGITGKEGEGLPIKYNEYAKRLNGNLIFVKGNHCKNNGINTRNHSIILKIGGINVYVVHDPKDAIIMDENGLYFPLNITAHVHEAWLTKEIKNKKGLISLCINCGVDQHKYFPISFDEVKAIYDQWYTKHPARKSINKLIISKG